MIRHTVMILPPVKRDIQISTILSNDSVVSEFNRVKRFAKIKNNSGKLYIKFFIMDMKTMHNVGVDYPNLYLDSHLYDESTKDYTRKHLKFKKDSVIIDTKLFKTKKIKFRVSLIDRGQVIDQCFIDIV